MAEIDIIESVSPFSISISPFRAADIDIVSATEAPINTNSTSSAVEIMGPPVVQNAIVSATPPTNPYEGLVWIDIS